MPSVRFSYESLLNLLNSYKHVLFAVNPLDLVLNSLKLKRIAPRSAPILASSEPNPTFFRLKTKSRNEFSKYLLFLQLFDSPGKLC
jgi:hypothetical protein